MSQSNHPVASEAIVSALEAGLPDQAERLALAFLEQAPADELGLTLLALSQQHQGRPRDAAAIYRGLVERQPDNARTWNNLATALREAGAFAEAEQAYLQSVTLDPDYYGAWMNLGFLRTERADYANARAAYLRALGLNNASVEARIYAAQMCYHLGDAPLALKLIEPRRIWVDLPRDLQVELGILLMRYGEVDEAVGLFENLLRRDPDDIRARANVALLYERMNRIDEARALLRGVPPLEELSDPHEREDVFDAHLALALRGSDAEHAHALLERSATSLPAQRQVNEDWYYSLASIYAKQKDVDRTMQALEKAHSIQLEAARQVVPELLAPDSQPLKTASVWIDQAQRAKWEVDPGAPDALASPIFIVGFPRSGTTMLEQMLDAHPGLQSMDERAFLQNLVEKMSDFGLRYPHDLDRLTPAQCEELRGLYQQLTAEVAPRREGQRLVDKNPMNMLRLPLINRLFPNAAIILALRHPCDVILSCYMQNFRSPAFAVLCSTLERLAKGYVAAMRFWLHHADLLKPRVMELRYEDLLDDFAGHAQKLAAFIRVDDATPMLHFDQHARAKGFISTPSYTQVIEPPHKKAIGRWLPYQRYFEPVLPILQPIMHHWSYEQ